MDEIRERVERGAALLDERVPGWVDRINVDRLNVSSLFDCPLGQVFDGFWAGHKRLWGELWMVSEARACGFGDLPKNYPRLNAAWKSLILSRRQAASDA